MTLIHVFIKERERARETGEEGRDGGRERLERKGGRGRERVGGKEKL